MGSNGLSAQENLKGRRSKPIFDAPAEVPRTKCEEHPTKRLYVSERDALSAASARTAAVGLKIVPYRCDSCGNIHLCKESNLRRSESLITGEARRTPVSVTAGNREARKRVLAEYLKDHPEPTTIELCEMLGGVVTTQTVRTNMRELGYEVSRGSNPHWRRKKTELSVVPPAVEAVDEAVERHPAGKLGVRELNIDMIAHIPVGDVLSTLRAAGLELRMEARWDR